MDLGGIGAGTNQHLHLDRLDSLVDGSTYEMVILYTQRHSTAAGFNLKTNIVLSTAGSVVASAPID